MLGLFKIQFKSLVKKLQCACAFFYFGLFGLKAFALEQQTKQWVGLNGQYSFGQNHHWLTYLFSQFRLIDQAHPWQAMLIEPALGYQITPEKSIWLGYRWTGRNPYHGFFQENRLIQQMISQKKNVRFRFIFRSRLEEITHSNASQIALRVRERFSVEIQHAVFKNALPFFYDEMFFELNHTNYQPRNFLGENRLFLGVNLYRTAKSWWELGYINQFQVKTPEQTQNQMSHILSVTYNFI